MMSLSSQLAKLKMKAINRLSIKSNLLPIICLFVFIIILINYSALRQHFNAAKTSSSITNVDAEIDTNKLVKAIRLEWDRSVGELANEERNGLNLTGHEFGRLFELASNLNGKSRDLVDAKLVISQHRRATISIGVPTVKRDETYLFTSLKSLIKACNSDELQHVLIIVFIAEVLLTLNNLVFG